MTTFYTLGARLSGMAAVACAVLAFLASPAVSRADEQSACEEACAVDNQIGSDVYDLCVTNCVQQGGLTKCSDASCQTSTMGCTNACVGKACNEGGKNPAKAKCSSASGCKCI